MSEQRRVIIHIVSLSKDCNDRCSMAHSFALALPGPRKFPPFDGLPGCNLQDLDCFYCQVEQKRLGIPREQPVAVQQWCVTLGMGGPGHRGSWRALRPGLRWPKARDGQRALHLVLLALLLLGGSC